LFLYHKPLPADKWLFIPWDLDKIFGYRDNNPMDYQQPLNFALQQTGPICPPPMRKA